MLFSVVIPTYNRLTLLPNTLASVAQQRFRDFEVIVVDDGSTDGTFEYLRSLNEVRVIRQSNAGPGAARNRGLEHAVGDYVAFLDSDDLWFPWTLETAAALINKYSNPAIVIVKPFEFQDASLVPTIAEEAVRANLFADYYSSCATACFVGSGLAIVRREMLTQSGGFIETRVNAEDHDMILRLGAARGFVQILAPATIAYRRHSASATGDAVSTAAGILRLVLTEKGGGYPGGADRALERRSIISSHARAAALGALRVAAVREAWKLYVGTFRWQVALLRWRFLIAFPVLAVRAWGRLRAGGRRHLDQGKP